MAGLYAPLPTLRRRPRGRLRTDRGRRGLLLLHRSGLSPHTPCQSPGALTHVTARRIAQPPKAAFVTRLQPCRLPGRAARQLPDQSTTLWVESSSTSDSRLRGALPTADVAARSFGDLRCRRSRLSSLKVRHRRNIAQHRRVRSQLFSRLVEASWSFGICTCRPGTNSRRRRWWERI